MTRLDAFCKAFGWHGGTIHQVATFTGCSVNDLLDTPTWNVEKKSGYAAGRAAGRADLLCKFHGNLPFWIGVADQIFVNELHAVEKNIKDRWISINN